MSVDGPTLTLLFEYSTNGSFYREKEKNQIPNNGNVEDPDARKNNVNPAQILTEHQQFGLYFGFMCAYVYLSNIPIIQSHFVPLSQKLG